jgi:hypothetical protein
MVTGPTDFRHDTSPVTILPSITRLNADLSQVSRTALPSADHRAIADGDGQVLSCLPGLADRRTDAPDLPPALHRRRDGVTVSDARTVSKNLDLQ